MQRASGFLFVLSSGFMAGIAEAQIFTGENRVAAGLLFAASAVLFIAALIAFHEGKSS